MWRRRKEVGMQFPDYIEDELEGRHQSVRDAFRGLMCSHLPAHLQRISEQVLDTALFMVNALPDDPELVVGLRKLREAKDCFVLTKVYHPEAGINPQQQTIPESENTDG